MRPDTLGILIDIRDAARYIAEDTAGATFEEFLQDRRMRQAVERNFTIIGEAMNRLRRRNPEVASRITAIEQIIGFRNVLIHGYDVINYATIWRTVTESLPPLCQEIEAMLPKADRTDTG
jgi:uncharacterized protein with HEPN domain